MNDFPKGPKQLASGCSGTRMLPPDLVPMNQGTAPKCAFLPSLEAYIDHAIQGKGGSGEHLKLLPELWLLETQEGCRGLVPRLLGKRDEGAGAPGVCPLES